MGEVWRITSSHNPRVKQLLALHHGRERRRSGLYVVEGARELTRYLQAFPQETLSEEGGLQLFISESAWQRGLEGELARRASSTRGSSALVILPDALFAKVSVRQSPDGVLGLAKQQIATWEQIDWTEPCRLVVAQHLEKPGNLGALLRIADGVGAKALILCDAKVEIYNPNVIRASMGSIFHLPTLTMGSEELIERAQLQGIELVAASPHATPLYHELRYHSSVALVVGAEDKGLTAVWRAPVAQLVRLPMVGRADSLNVASAAAVCLYEILRQHTEGQRPEGQRPPCRAREP